MTPELCAQFGRAAEQLGDALEEIMPYLGANELACRLDRRGVLIVCEVRNAEALAMIEEMIVERDGDRVSFVLPEDARGPMPIPEGVDVRAEVRDGRVRMTVTHGAAVLYDATRDLVS